MDEGYAGATGFGLGLLLMLLMYAGLCAFAVYVHVRIARKAGYSGWYAALMFVPVVNLAAMIAFAFVEWPVERELREARGGGYRPQSRLAAPPAGQTFGVVAPDQAHLTGQQFTSTAYPGAPAAEGHPDATQTQLRSFSHAPQAQPFVQPPQPQAFRQPLPDTQPEHPGPGR